MSRPVTLRPIRPNVGLQRAYQRRLDRLIGEMHRSVSWWVRAQYRRRPPEMARDASPAVALRDTIGRLTRQWQDKFDDLAPEMARYFATLQSDRVDGAMQAMLKKAGYSVALRLTRAQNDVLQATIAENVSLIRSIASEYLSDVEGLVMRSVTAGRDLGTLTEELVKRYAITRRRAAFISLDQNNKATSSLARARKQELELYYERWLHSAGGKVPRPSHVKASRDGVIFDIRVGWLDPATGKRTWPGVEPGCRCVGVTVLNWPKLSKVA